MYHSSLQNRRYFVAVLGKAGQARGGRGATETRHDMEAIIAELSRGVPWIRK